MKLSINSISLNPLPEAFSIWAKQWCEAFLEFESKVTNFKNSEDELLNTFLALQALYTELDLKNLWQIDLSKISVQDVSTVQYLYYELFFFSLNKISKNDSIKKIYLNAFTQNGSTPPEAFESCKDFVFISFLNRPPQNINIAMDLWNFFVSIIEQEFIRSAIPILNDKNKDAEKIL